MPRLEAPAAPWGTMPTPPPPPPPAGTGAPDEPTGPDSGGIGTGQKATIGVVVLLVVALFGYMVVHSGPDRKRERQLAAADARADAEPVPTISIPPSTTSSTAPHASTPPPAVGPSELPVDAAKFCNGVRHTYAFEMRFSASEVDDDWQAIKATVVEGRPAWEQAVADMLAGGSPAVQEAVTTYRDTYRALLDRLANATSGDDEHEAFRLAAQSDLQSAVVVLTNQVKRHC
jgi:hypothetical protein